MSNHSAPPPPVAVTDYPGYFPPSKPPFWTRLKTSAAVGTLALLVGMGIGAASGSSSSAAIANPAPKAVGVSADAVQQQVDQAVSDAKDTLHQKFSTQRSTLMGRLSRQHDKASSAKQAAVAAAVARTRSADKARQAAAVAAARAKARQLAATPNPPTQPSSPPASSSNLDPRFSYCYEANASGYGPYYQGQDPEYYWYEDADNDGIDCEP